jgi:hypothetical protein
MIPLCRGQSNGSRTPPHRQAGFRAANGSRTRDLKLGKLAHSIVASTAARCSTNAPMTALATCSGRRLAIAVGCRRVRGRCTITVASTSASLTVRCTRTTIWSSVEGAVGGDVGRMMSRRLPRRQPGGLPTRRCRAAFPPDALLVDAKPTALGSRAQLNAVTVLAHCLRTNPQNARTTGGGRRRPGGVAGTAQAIACKFCCSSDLDKHTVALHSSPIARSTTGRTTQPGTKPTHWHRPIERRLLRTHAIASQHACRTRRKPNPVPGTHPAIHPRPQKAETPRKHGAQRVPLPGFEPGFPP